MNNAAPALLETWLSKYEHSPYNLGESSVENYSLGELLKLTNIEHKLNDISLANNDTRGSLLLRESISDIYDNVNPNNILLTAGTTEAIFIYFHVRYKQKANVVVPTPDFHVLHEVPEHLGYEVRKVPLRLENGFHLDLDELKKQVDNNTRVIVLNTPHNPTGIVYSDEEIQTIIDLAEKYNVDILVDEHYRFLPHNNTGILPSLYSRSPNMVALGSIGKCFGCIGLRTGWIIASDEIIEDCHYFKDYTTHTVSGINDFITAHALINREKILPRYRDYIGNNLIQLEQFILQQEGRIDWVKPDAGTIAYPYFTEKNFDALNFSKKLVEQEGVLLLPGEAFDMPKHFRIALGVNPAFFQEALFRFSSLLKKIK